FDTTDADGDGIYEVSVLTDDGNGNVVPKTFHVTVSDVAEVPTVESVVINDGTAQRSMVTSLTVTFDREVTLGSGAFEVTDGGGNQIVLQVNSNSVNGKTVSTITFPGLTGGSLQDGNYRLTVNSELVHVGADQMETDHIDAFFRLFGDVDGDRDVDSLDYLAFRSTYRRTAADSLFNEAFDADGDGDVDTADYLIFRSHYRTRLAP
ncbi:MAG: hypothetical protein KDA85_09260, partial [Planctomycetaceae bacterium]|nr:hypothetical protein [Planctomycetaceae bacterium]